MVCVAPKSAARHADLALVHESPRASESQPLPWPRGAKTEGTLLAVFSGMRFAYPNIWTIAIALNLTVRVGGDRVAIQITRAGAEPAHAREGSQANDSRTTVSVDTAARFAPDGIMLFAGILRRWRSADGDGAILQGRYFELGGAVGVNPAYSQASAHVEWVPIAPIQLRAQYDLYGFFGVNGALLRFPSAMSRFGDSEIQAAHGSESSGLGQRILVSPVLRARAGRVLLRSQTDVAWFALSPTAGWFYEWEYDTLVARHDLVASNRTALLLELWHGAGDAMLLVGPSYEVTHATKADITRQRAEGVLFWSPTELFGPFARPRLFAVAGVNLEDRNRRYAPFAVFGVGTDLDR